MALTSPKHRTKAELAEQVEHDRIAILVAAYEAVRLIPGPARNAATSALEIALRDHGQPFPCGSYIYRWCREEDSISRLPSNRRSKGAMT
jgi:hypothetical protein